MCFFSCVKGLQGLCRELTEGSSRAHCLDYRLYKQGLRSGGNKHTEYNFVAFPLYYCILFKKN